MSLTIRADVTLKEFLYAAFIAVDDVLTAVRRQISKRADRENIFGCSYQAILVPFGALLGVFILYMDFSWLSEAL